MSKAEILAYNRGRADAKADTEITKSASNGDGC